jgi:hypothetical protein
MAGATRDDEVTARYLTPASSDGASARTTSGQGLVGRATADAAALAPGKQTLTSSSARAPTGAHRVGEPLFVVTAEANAGRGVTGRRTRTASGGLRCS